jgi:hypothetical protein
MINVWTIGNSLVMHSAELQKHLSDGNMKRN